MPVARVSGLVHDRGSAGLRALFEKAALPPSTYPAFKDAIEAMREGFGLEASGAARLKRRMIERVLTRCEDQEMSELAPLLTLLRRFATEAAREEARMFCDELVAEDYIDIRPVAALKRGLTLRDAGNERRREDALEIIRPVTILVPEKLVGDFAEPPCQRAGDISEINAGIFANDGAHGVDVLVDERQRDALHVGRMFEQAAQALDHPGGTRITECRGLALDVVGGAE